MIKATDIEEEEQKVEETKEEEVAATINQKKDKPKDK